MFESAPGTLSSPEGDSAVPKPLENEHGSDHTPRWVRELQLRDIIVGWGALILAGVLIGAVADFVGWTFARDITANLVPDLFVAGLALAAAESVFKLRERRGQQVEEENRLREHRAEESRRRTEALLKAYSLIIGEMYDNRNTLTRFLGIMQGGSMPKARMTLNALRRENWELLVQGPLVARLSVELVWTLQEAYYESQSMLDRLESERDGTGPQTWDRLAKGLIPTVEAELSHTDEAIKMLEGALPKT
jgi:hypothetical protein